MKDKGGGSTIFADIVQNSRGGVKILGHKTGVKGTLGPAPLDPQLILCILSRTASWDTDVTIADWSWPLAVVRSKQPIKHTPQHLDLLIGYPWGSDTLVK